MSQEMTTNEENDLLLSPNPNEEPKLIEDEDDLLNEPLDDVKLPEIPAESGKRSVTPENAVTIEEDPDELLSAVAEQEPLPSRMTSMDTDAGPTSSDNSNGNKCVGVFGLSVETSQKDLFEHFNRFGAVDHVHLIVDSRTCISKGFGFVTFATHEDAQHAIDKTNGGRLHKRQIRVDFSKTRGAKPRTPGQYMGPAKWGGAMSKKEKDLPVIPDYFHNMKTKRRPYRIQDEPDYKSPSEDEDEDSSSSSSSSSDSDSDDEMATGSKSHGKRTTTRDQQSSLITPTHTYDPTPRHEYADDDEYEAVPARVARPSVDSGSDSDGGASLGEDDDDEYRRSSSRYRSRSNNRASNSRRDRDRYYDDRYGRRSSDQGRSSGSRAYFGELGDFRKRSRSSRDSRDRRRSRSPLRRGQRERSRSPRRSRY